MCGKKKLRGLSICYPHSLQSCLCWWSSSIQSKTPYRKNCAPVREYYEYVWMCAVVGYGGRNDLQDVNLYSLNCLSLHSLVLGYM
ncbi:hypothetical protein TNCT_176921 [Trichonephila clavata]|uniref:Uncharacterized protein n=1 Tax=Trichonephila clavata TaxID=2740835 RepID=A0A8X6LJM6_TRICU|nr:hypothetical protein TNCT_176921 [Trichonephila clavata]